MSSNKALPGRWLRHKTDGTIYGYTAHFANNPLVEEVSEEEAFPERFLTEKQKARKGRKAKVDLSTEPTKVEAVTPEPVKSDASVAAGQQLAGKE